LCYRSLSTDCGLGSEGNIFTDILGGEAAPNELKSLTYQCKEKRPDTMDNNTLAIYIHELRNQCLHSQASFDLFNQALNGQQGQGILYGGQMILMPASQLSSILWPTRARARARGEALRKVLQLSDKHALNDRRLSEVWERSDEKIDEWVAATKGEQIVIDYVGDPASLGENGTSDNCMYRGYNPATQIYTYRGVSFNLPAVGRAINDIAGRVNAVFRQMFPEQAKAEDEQQKKLLEAQKAAQKAAPAAPAIAGEKKAEAKPAKKVEAKKPVAKKPAAKKRQKKRLPLKKTSLKKRHRKKQHRKKQHQKR